MKRILAFATFALLCSVPANATILDLENYVSGNDITVARLSGNVTTTENWANGNVEGGVNIKSGSLVSQDFARSTSPIVRWDESFNDYTISGMLPATDSDLTSDISAGTSYVTGIRIQKTAEAHTYTASKDTWVYINEGGSYYYNEQTLGAAAPTTRAGDLLLAKVVTDATTISSVSDLRTTSIQITTTTTNFPADYRSQCFVSRDSTTTMHLEPGSIAIGSTVYTRTTDTSTKTVTTGSNWIENGYPAGDVTGGIGVYLYAYNDAGSTWDFKFSSADPVYSDTSLNTSAIKRYYASGGITYRAAGWAWVSADTVQAYEFGNFKDVGVSNVVRRYSDVSYSLSSTVSHDIAGLLTQFYSSGTPVRLKTNYSVLDAGTGVTTLTTNYAINQIAMLDSEQIGSSGRSVGYNDNFTNEYLAHLPQGWKRVKVQGRVNANSSTIRNRALIVEES